MPELTTYKISKHAQTRYSERIMGKEDANSINRFIAENEDKIATDINKLITYGEMIFAGKQSQKDGKGNVLNVYLKDTWVVLVDTKSEIVVTLYRIDLGCGDDFNLQYISKMMDKLKSNKENLENTILEVEKETFTYKELINDAQAQIKEYKAMIKNLEEMSSAYQSIIDNNVVKITQATRAVADTVNTLVGKREF